MIKTGFLHRWMAGACAWFALVGLFVALGASTGAFWPYNLQIARHFWGVDAIPASALEFYGFAAGPLGGTIAGKWVAALYVVWGPLRRGERWAWGASVGGLLSWFLVDSVASAIAGAWFNVWMINLAPLLIFGLPLALSRGRLEPAGASSGAAPRRSAAIKGLAGLCGFFVLVGAFVAFCNGSSVMGVYNGALAERFWGVGEIPADMEAFKVFMFGPIGATISGQFVLLGALAWWPMARGERWALRASWASLLTWVVIDSTITAIHGAWFNLVQVNLLTMALMVPALLLAGRAMGEFGGESGVGGAEGGDGGLAQ